MASYFDKLETMGGTTESFLALQFPTAGALDRTDGLFRSARGAERICVAIDNLNSPAYRGLLADYFIDIVSAQSRGAWT